MSTIKLRRRVTLFLFMDNASQHGFPPYILVVNGDPMLAWLMVLFEDNLQSILYSLITYFIHFVNII